MLFLYKNDLEVFSVKSFDAGYYYTYVAYIFDVFPISSGIFVRCHCDASLSFEISVEIHDHMWHCNHSKATKLSPHSPLYVYRV